MTDEVVNRRSITEEVAFETLSRPSITEVAQTSGGVDLNSTQMNALLNIRDN